MDIENEGNREIISEAAKENQDIFNGEEVDLNRGATTAHIQKHIDFAYEKDLTDEIRAKIIEHIQGEIPIAQKNAMRKAAALVSMGGQVPPGQPGQQMQPGQAPQAPGMQPPVNQPMAPGTEPKPAPVNPQG
jgi:hypothetical protein